MPKKSVEDSIIRIETTQAALRDCIQRAKQLADDSERLIRQHKADIIQPEPVNPAR